MPHPWTVRRWLRAEGIYSCWAAGKPLLTTAHQEARVKFANEHMDFDWSKVVFSDEKIWRIRKGGRVRVWRRKGKRFAAKYTVPTVAKAEGVMVWCAINSAGELVVRRCPTTVDSQGYQDILESAKKFIRSRCQPLIFQLDSKSDTSHRVTTKRVYFQQDGASIHQSKSTKEWLARQGVRLLNGGVWPAHSPDLNPVEHVWPYVTRQLEDRVFNSKDDLWSALESAFAAVPPAAIQKLYTSMSRRLAAVLVARGGNTKY
jgi:transposase